MSLDDTSSSFEFIDSTYVAADSVSKTSVDRSSLASNSLIVQNGRPQNLSIIMASGALSTAGTSSDTPMRIWAAPYRFETDATTSGSHWPPKPAEQTPEMTRQAISELRKLSGLTWEQLGQLFHVSRRSIHFWASGKPLSAQNEARLMRILDIIRYIDRGNARSNRTALFEVRSGTTCFELLATQRFDEARALLGCGPGRAARQPRPELSAEAKAANKPLPLEALFDAKHDRVHREPGRARTARTVRQKRRGRS